MLVKAYSLSGLVGIRVLEKVWAKKVGRSVTEQLHELCR